jgi:hypothetical protein
MMISSSLNLHYYHQITMIYLSFVYRFWGDLNDEYLRQDLFAFFSERKHKEQVAQFLYNKYKANIEDLQIKADIIQILGHLRSKYAKEVALENITVRR